MDPWTAVGFGASGLVGGLFNWAGQSSANAANAEMQRQNMRWMEGERQIANEFATSSAREQRDWAERMSNTQFERTVEGMRKAGLNPATMLAGGQGPVAAPGGDSARPNMPGSPGLAHVESTRFGDAVQRAVSSALEGAQYDLSKKSTNSQVDVNTAVEGVKKKEQDIMAHSARRAKTEADLSVYSLDARKAEADADLNMAEYAKRHPRLMFYLNKVAGPAASSARDVAIGAAAGLTGIGKLRKSGLPRQGEVILNTATGEFR